MFLQSFNWGEGCKLRADAVPPYAGLPSQSASSPPQPKVNTSLQNPSALPTKCIGAEACIYHSDKHLTLQEHMLSLLKLLIALNTFSYRGLFATNCSQARRGPPHPSQDETLGCCSSWEGLGFGSCNSKKIAEKVTLAKSFIFLMLISWLCFSSSLLFRANVCKSILFGFVYTFALISSCSFPGYSPCHTIITGNGIIIRFIIISGSFQPGMASCYN